jgi:hypothetical protein
MATERNRFVIINSHSSLLSPLRLVAGSGP